MGDPTKTFYGRSLGRAPDGGAPADYSKGWRFLPADVKMPKGSKTLDGSPAEGYWSHEILKDQLYIQEPENPYPVATQAGRDWTIDQKGKLTRRVTSRGLAVVKAMKDLHANPNNAQAQKVIDDAYHQLILAPQIKAQEEQLAKQKKAKELEYATLKMRVIELEKPTAPAISISTERSWSKFAILGIAIVGFIIILRRKA